MLSRKEIYLFSFTHFLTVNIFLFKGFKSIPVLGVTDNLEKTIRGLTMSGGIGAGLI